MFDNKTLLITGGTGSFGNAVLRRFLDSDLGEIRIFSRDEKKQDDMRKRYKHPKLKFYIGDVRDVDSVRTAMRGALTVRRRINKRSRMEVFLSYRCKQPPELAFGRLFWTTRN